MHLLTQPGRLVLVAVKKDVICCLSFGGKTSDKRGFRK
jgi:hypothetical protein